MTKPFRIGSYYTRDEIGALTARIAAEYGAAMQLTTLSQRAREQAEAKAVVQW